MFKFLLFHVDQCMLKLLMCSYIYAFVHGLYNDKVFAVFFQPESSQLKLTAGPVCRASLVRFYS